MEELAIKLITKGFGKLAGKVLGDKGKKTVDKIEEFLGVKGEDAIMEKLDDPKVVEELHKFQIDKMNIELDNLKNAREMIEKTGTKYTEELSRNIIRYNMLFVFVIFILNAAIIYYSKKYNVDITIVASLGNLSGFIINSLIQERKDVTGFWLASSIGSKLKDIKTKVFGKNNGNK